jgi:hypothetical protein
MEKTMTHGALPFKQEEEKIDEYRYLRYNYYILEFDYPQTKTPSRTARPTDTAISQDHN